MSRGTGEEVDFVVAEIVVERDGCALTRGTSFVGRSGAAARLGALSSEVAFKVFKRGPHALRSVREACGSGRVCVERRASPHQLLSIPFHGYFSMRVSLKSVS